MRVLVTGGSGVLGRALLPLLAEAGHDVSAPRREELDLLDARAVAGAVAGRDAVYHLASRIPPPERRRDREAWRENDRLRRDASRLLVDAALAGETETYVQPSLAYLSSTPPRDVPPHLESALAAEREAARFAAAGRRGVVLRLGLLDGPGTDHDRPSPAAAATLHVADAGRALLAALKLPSGVYDVARESERLF